MFAVPLSNGRYAHARYCLDATLALYPGQRDTPDDVPLGRRDFVLHLSVHLDNLLDGDWPLVGSDAFGECEDPWPPPSYIKDFITGDYRIYEKGKMRPARQEEWRDLEEAAVWEGAAAREKIAAATGRA